MEGIIQHKSGLNAIKATLIRITTAVLTVFIVSQFLGDTSQSVAVPTDLTAQVPLLEALKVWLMGMIGLLLKIFGIIMVVMILLESLRTLGWIEYLLRFSRPLMRALGLSDRTAMMWVAGVLFGLVFGGAVIVEETKKVALTKGELERLHIFIGCNHAMVEDPALFAVLGLNAFWLWVPRFVAAVIAVQVYRAIRYLKNKLLRLGGEGY